MLASLRPAMVAWLIAFSAGVTAQQPPGSKTGNPTPGTPQPDPPNLADRISLTGCVQLSSGPAGRSTAPDPNTPSDSRFVLAQAARLEVVPPGTGTSGLAAAPASPTYRLLATDSQLSPFVGTKVQISGEILPLASDATAARTMGPRLQVEFVQKLAPRCP